MYCHNVFNVCIAKMYRKHNMDLPKAKLYKKRYTHFMPNETLIPQGWKFMSGSHNQKLGQLADLASDWLFTCVQPIRSQLAVDPTLDTDYNS